MELIFWVNWNEFYFLLSRILSKTLNHLFFNAQFFLIGFIDLALIFWDNFFEKIIKLSQFKALLLEFIEASLLHIHFLCFLKELAYIVCLGNRIWLYSIKKNLKNFTRIRWLFQFWWFSLLFHFALFVVIVNNIDWFCLLL